MATRRLSISMIEQMDCSDSVKSMDSFEFDDESSGGQAEFRGVRKIYNSQYIQIMQPSKAMNNSNINQLQQQQQQQQEMTPHLRSEINTSSVMRSTNSSFSSTGSGITFYQSPSKESFMDRHDCHRIDSEHRGRSTKPAEPHQRGIDRSITLPRENHLVTDTSELKNVYSEATQYVSTQNCNTTWIPSSPMFTAISPNHASRKVMQQPQSNVVTPVALMVTPEVTRPKTFQPIVSASSMIPSMPPLYPTSPPPTLSSSRYSSPQRQCSAVLQSSNQRARKSIGTLRSERSLYNREHSIDMATPWTTPQANISKKDETMDSRSTSPINVAASTTPDSTNVSKSVDVPTTPSTVPIMIEVAPGVQIHLRGAAETQMAIKTGFYIQCECLFCSVSKLPTTSSPTVNQEISSINSSDSNIYCILDCDYFICPTCRSMHPNPISYNSNVTDASTITEYPGGLGLGFRLEKK